MNGFLTINEVAKIARVHHMTVRRWLASGDLRYSKAGRQYRIKTTDLYDFMGVASAQTEKEIK